ncbi:acylase [Algibacter mikhailovii]|uniref:acylase n=1 Tax=Algibacter mikhailovii TaxID=425498 RepID=UPI0024940146|nr:acylase [Algibacter mikhailovii]
MAIKQIYFVLALILFNCSNKEHSNQVHDDQARWHKHQANTEIIRDDFGVPHIYGKTDADAVFGLLYAQCEDDFNRVEQNYIWATGRLAEVEGAEALYSDLRARLFMTQEQAKENYNKSPEWLKELCLAFADGINFYLHNNPDVKPKLITHFEPWMPMYFSEGSIGGDIERISTKKLKMFYDSGMDIPLNRDLDLQKEQEMAEPKGSNGIAISGKLTQSGNPLLLINPHTSFYFRGEVHAVSEQGLNAYGAVTWGQFFIYQGFNEKTGWMHTSTYTDILDEFKETIKKTEQGLFYKYGDEWKPVNVSEFSLKYKEGNTLKEKSFPVYHTHHGPITHMQDKQWVSTAMMWNPTKALEQSYTRTKQSSYKGFRAMMNLRTNSSNNTVYADAEGNIAYFHGNFIPVRDTVFDYTKPVDGSNPKTDWKGLHTVDENILILNPENGWIQNCNSTPFTAAAEFSPKKKDYPNYMSEDEENFRGVHAIALLTNSKGYTIDNLIELAHDSYLPAFEALIPGLIKAYDELDQSESLNAPINILRQWDYRTSKESVAMTLAHFYAVQFIKNAEWPKGFSGMEFITYCGEASPLEQRIEIFKQTVSQLEQDFGFWEIPWGEVNRFQRLNGEINQTFDDDKPSIPIGFASAWWGALAAYGGSINKTTKKLYGTRGNSFVAVVEFGDKVKAKSMLVGGQSGHPNSKHFNDQAQPYADVQFKTVPFYKEDVLKRAVSRYHPGDE